MLTNIWYYNEDKIPEKEGYYFGYKLSTIGDDSEGYGLYYWRSYYGEWRESRAPHSHRIRVSMWCELPDVKDRISSRLLPTAAEIDAWKNVEDAVAKYNMIKSLVQ